MLTEATEEAEAEGEQGAAEQEAAAVEAEEAVEAAEEARPGGHRRRLATLAVRPG